MKVSIDKTRILHLITLILLTLGGGQLLMKIWPSFNGLTAYGLICTIVCQISNIVMKLTSSEEEGSDDDDNNKGEANKTGGTKRQQQNPKKKRK